MTATASNVKATLLFTALAAVLFSAAPALAQETPPPDTTETDAGVPKDRLVDEYSASLFSGDDVAAGDAITGLRTGGDFTVEVTYQDTNPDGTPAVDANGNPVMVTEQRAVTNPNGPMGWGEIDHSLGLAQALVDTGQAASFDEALLGAATTTTVTNPDGTTTTTTTYEGGLLGMRADGMGWGQIAKELGFKSLGEIKSGRYADADTEAEVESTATVASDKSAKGRDTAKATHDNHGKSADHKPERTAKAERITGRPEKIERIAKIDRPERPERPIKPERSGRP